ncbi:hypothetical protein ACJX0J_035841, partial [Zea mays]
SKKWNINHEILSKYATIINPIKNSISSIRLELSNLGYDFHKIKKFWMNLNFILFELEILLIEFINFLQGTLMIEGTKTCSCSTLLISHLLEILNSITVL